ncbi:hypothetical protein ElyMa_003364000 [Elysia marginata]|uniref:Apple domain-containing protein n=1 Tax=Elysia marginata TaxID=1093978 RepID=A0AAV4JLK6_9GAST|nr:hypothetical protein ElyMa_003364000 [Elysia marginata]
MSYRVFKGCLHIIEPEIELHKRFAFVKKRFSALETSFSNSTVDSILNPDTFTSTCTSRSECALLCTNNVLNRCTAFRYDPTSDACLIADSYRNLLIPKVGLEVEESEIYVGCDLSQGFKIHRHGNITACLQCRQKSVAYKDAEKACQDMESSMVTAESQDKRQMLLLNMIENKMNRIWASQYPTQSTLEADAPNIESTTSKCTVMQRRRKDIIITKTPCRGKYYYCCEL